MDLQEISNVDRREFLKNLPRQLVNGMRSIAADVGAPFMAPDGKMDQGGAMNRAPTLNSGSRIARLDVARCLAWSGMNCQLCYLACPLRDRAIEMRDQKPVIIASACNGCAMCEVACKTVNDLPALGISLLAEVA